MSGARIPAPQLTKGKQLDDLIEALTIFRKYLPERGNHCPTSCGYDEMYIMDVDPSDVTQEDAARLDDIGFFVSEEGDCFKSFRFGSA